MVAESIRSFKFSAGYAYLIVYLIISPRQNIFMKTEAQVNDDILKITMKIQQQFPELVQYITEMPVTIPDSNDPEISIKKLQEYYDSLTALVNKYSPSHGITNI